MGYHVEGLSPHLVEFITDTVARTALEHAYAIQAIEDTVIATITARNKTATSNNDASMSGKTLLAGHVWYMDISSVMLTSGSVIVYYK